MRLVVAALMLAACGRLGFDHDAVAFGTDAASSDGTQALHGPCGPVTAAPDPLTITGVTYQFTDFIGDTNPITQTTVDALDPTGTVVAETTSDNSGNYTLVVPTGGVAPRLTLTFTHLSYMTSATILDAPLDRDATGTINVVWSNGDGPLWSPGAMASVYSTSSQTVNSADSTLSVSASDCAGNPLPGVTITVDPVPAELDYLGVDGLPDLAATATVAPYTQMVGFNAQPGTTHISATAPGYTFEDQTVEIIAGDHMALIEMRPIE